MNHSVVFVSRSKLLSFKKNLEDFYTEVIRISELSTLIIGEFLGV